MSESKPTTPWDELYRKAGFIQETAPWTFLAESDMFGLIDEVSRMRVYVQAMGGLGEHAAVSLYLGDESLLDLLQALDSEAETEDDHDEVACRIADIAQLQLVFDQPKGIAPDERKWLKRHGVDQPGRGVRPVVRRFGWGLLPFVLLDIELGEMLLRLMPSLIAAFESVRGGRPIPKMDFDQLTVPFLASGSATGEHAWEMRPLAPGADDDASLLVDDAALADIASLKPGGLGVDLLLMRGGEPIIDFEATPPEPYFPLVMLAIDQQNGMLTPPVFLAHPLSGPLPILAQRAFAELARENFGKCPRHITLWPMSFARAMQDLLDAAGVDEVEISPDIVPEEWCEMANIFPAYLPVDYADDAYDADGGFAEDVDDDDDADDEWDADDAGPPAPLPFMPTFDR